MGDHEAVYDIGYGYANPCRYLQQALNGFLRCLGLERSGGGGGGEGGGEMDDPPSTTSSDDPLDDDAPASATGFVRRRPRPSIGPISSGGPGQTN